MEPIFVAQDTGSSVAVTIKRADGTILDLTGATVQFAFQLDGGSLLAKKTVLMTVAAPLTGVATYRFLATELPPQRSPKKTSTLTGEVRVTDNGGKVLTGLQFITATVRNRLT